jgi:phage FluMu protein gp41
VDELDQTELGRLHAALAEGAWEFPGRLFSHLANLPGPHYRDPFGWREIIDAELEAGRVAQINGRLAVVSAEDVEARAAALAHVDSRTPMALEPRAEPVAALFESAPESGEIAFQPPGPNVPPEAENPAEPPDGYCFTCFSYACDGHADSPEPGIRELTQGEMFALDLNATAMAEEQGGQFAFVSQPDPPVKRKRRTAEEVAAGKAAKAQAVADAKAARAAERDALKIARAQERVAAKAEAARQKLEEAEGGLVELPAVVFRDGTVRHVSDPDAWAVIEMHLDHLFLDCENSGYPLGHRLYELRTIQLGGEHAVIVFDAADPAQLEIVKLALALAVKISSHSSGADDIPLVAAGLISWDDIWAKTHDSVLYLKLTDPKLSGSDASKLKEAAGDLLFEYAVSPNAEKAKNALFKAMGCLTETDVTTPPERSGWYNVNKNSVVMTVYAGSDVLDLAAVMRVLPPLPVDDSVLERERWFEAKCARVGLDGFALDSPHIKKMIEKHENAKNESRANVAILSENRILNPSSPDVAKALMAQFPEITLGISKKTGDPSAAKKELEKVARTDLSTERGRHLHYLCKQILAYRHDVTTLGLLLRPLETLCDYGDARMRPTVYTINADTGRTSCVRPNGQQFSRQGDIRACVVAGEMNLELVNGKWEVIR